MIHSLSIITAVILLLIRSSLQVDIIISCPGIGPSATSTCVDIPAGMCCRAINFFPDGGPDRVPSPAVGRITFQHLLVGDIAAVWEHQEGPPGTTPTGCDTRVYQSRVGPGEYIYTVAEDPNYQSVGGGSYIKINSIRLPPDPPTVAQLVAQRVLGLVWAGGSWFSNPAAQKRFQGKRKKTRDVRSVDKGQVYAGPPARWRYPTYVDVGDGTRFSDDGAGNHIYKDKQGRVLNLEDGTIGEAPTA
ncbi:MAG: hypothetical protein Q9174_003819 [Haloplaca sp. 1 TL-2023]